MRAHPPAYTHPARYFQVTAESVPADVNGKASIDLWWEKDEASAMPIAAANDKRRNAVLLHGVKLVL